MTTVVEVFNSNATADAWEQKELAKQSLHAALPWMSVVNRILQAKSMIPS